MARNKRTPRVPSSVTTVNPPTPPSYVKLEDGVKQFILLPSDESVNVTVRENPPYNHNSLAFGHNNQYASVSFKREDFEELIAQYDALTEVPDDRSE